MNVQNTDALKFLDTIKDLSVDLILTDPPYIISKNSGMNTLKNSIAEGNCSKSEQEWEAFSNNRPDIGSFTDKQHQNYLEFGSVYGKKYSVTTDYGQWDSEFTMEYLEKVIENYYKKLKNGGTMIMFLSFLANK